MICPECDEFFDVVTNTYGAGLNYCPCCRHELAKMKRVEVLIPKKLQYPHPGSLNYDNYNYEIYTCLKCNSNQYEYYYKSGFKGFCVAPWESERGNLHAHVWECQECFSIWWHHTSWDMIKMSIDELKE